MVHIHLGHIYCTSMLLFFHLGCCLVVDSVPEVGSTIAGFENETNILVQCKVVDGSNQQITIWSILVEDDTDGVPDLINNNNADYNITGDTVSGSITFRTNLTIRSLTADFDRAVLYCGTSDVTDVANFTIRIYRKLFGGGCM